MAVGVVIGVIGAIVGVLVLIICWACCFYKFYYKARRKKNKEKKEAAKESAEKDEEKAERTTTTTSSYGNRNGISKVPKYPHYNLNKGVNLAYDGSLENSKDEHVKSANISSYSNGTVNTYSTSVYKEQYSTDSGTSISEVLDYPAYGNNHSRQSGSDSEGHRSVTFAEALPTLRGDKPPEDGRDKIPKTKVAYYIKPPPTPRGKPALPYQYAGTTNPAYVKTKSGRRRARSKDVVAVPIQVPQSTKRKSRDIQQMQPSDVCVTMPPTSSQPKDAEPPQSKARKLVSMLTRKSDTSRDSKGDSKGEDSPFPLLDNVLTAGRPPGQKPVRTGSILKKPKPRGDAVPPSPSESMTSQSGTDNSMSETDMGMVRQTTPRRSKRRRPKSIRNINSSDNSMTGQADISNTNVPPVAQSSPQIPVRYRQTPENSLDKISYSDQKSFDSNSSEIRPRMPYDYYPPKSPGDRILDGDMDELPRTAGVQKRNNPYDSAVKRKSNRSSSELDSNYFSGSSPRNNYTSNSEAGQQPASADAMQSRQKRRRKKSTKRSNRPQVDQMQPAAQPAGSIMNSSYDNIGYVDDEETTDIYSMQSKARVRSHRAAGMSVTGSHSSETEI